MDFKRILRSFDGLIAKNIRKNVRACINGQTGERISAIKRKASVVSVSDMRADSYNNKATVTMGFDNLLGYYIDLGWLIPLDFIAAEKLLGEKVQRHPQSRYCRVKIKILKGDLENRNDQFVALADNL